MPLRNPSLDGGFCLPPIPAPAKPQPLSPTGIILFVERIAISGNTAVRDEELAAIAAPYEGRKIDSSELEALRRALTRHYVDKGYVNSGAIIPDQEVKDGVVRLEIVEGELTNIVVSGLGRLRDEYVLGRVELGAGPPLNVNELQGRLQILLQDPLIERLNARLGPGVRPGQRELELEVERARPWDFGLAVANNRSPSVGAIHGGVFGTARNLTCGTACKVDPC